MGLWLILLLERRPICFSQYANTRVCNSLNVDTGPRVQYLWTHGAALLLWVAPDMATFQVHTGLLLFIHSSIIHTHTQLAWNHKGVWSHWPLRSTSIQFIYQCLQVIFCLQQRSCHILFTMLLLWTSVNNVVSGSHCPRLLNRRVIIFSASAHWNTLEIY